MDELNLYDDLDEFQEQQDKKSKELQDVEEKYQQSLKTIEELETNNRTLKKKIQRIELSFQSLLDTARTEIKRKDKEIERLRKEKDDICFRRRIPQQRAKALETQHIEEEPLTIQQQQFVKNPFRSEQTEIIASASHNSDIAEEVLTTRKDKNCKEDSQDGLTVSNKRYRSHDENRDGYDHKKAKNYHHDEKYHERTKFLKSDRDPRNKERNSERERRDYKDDSRNRLARYPSPDNKNVDKQSLNFKSPERRNIQLERARSSCDKNRDHYNKSLETGRRCDRKNDYKLSESPEDNRKRQGRGRSRERKISDRHLAKDWNRSKSRDRKYSDRNTNKSKSPERKDYKHNEGRDRSRHHDELSKNKFEKPLNTFIDVYQDLGNQEPIDYYDEKDENPINPTGEQHLSKGNQYNEIANQKKEEKKVNSSISKNDKNDQEIRQQEKKDESIKTRKAKEENKKNTNGNVSTQHKIQQVSDNKHCAPHKDKFLYDELFDTLPNTSYSSSRDTDTCSSKVDLNADNYSTDLTKIDLINDTKEIGNNLNKNNSSVEQKSTTAQKLCTPRKLALYDSLFGPSPSNCSSNISANNSGTSSKSLLSNIKNILANASNTTNIEVISSATTSPEDYTDKKTSFETDDKIYDPNDIDNCFTKNYVDKEIKKNIKSVDLTKDDDIDNINAIEFIQIPGLDLPVPCYGKNDKTYEECFNDKLKVLFENNSKSEAVTANAGKESEDEICIINEDNSLQSSFMNNSNILPASLDDSCEHLKTKETTILEYSKVDDCNDKNSTSAKTSKIIELSELLEVDTRSLSKSDIAKSNKSAQSGGSELDLDLISVKPKESYKMARTDCCTTCETASKKAEEQEGPISTEKQKTLIIGKAENLSQESQTIQESNADNCILSENTTDSTKSSEIRKNEISEVKSIQRQEIECHTVQEYAAKKTDYYVVSISAEEQDISKDSKEENPMQEYQKLQESALDTFAVSESTFDSTKSSELISVNDIPEAFIPCLDFISIPRTQEVFISTEKQKPFNDSQAKKAMQDFPKVQETVAENFIVPENTFSSTKSSESADKNEISKVSIPGFDMILEQTQKPLKMSAIECLLANEIAAYKTENPEVSLSTEQEDIKAKKQLVEIQTVEEITANNLIVSENTLNSTKTTKLATLIANPEVSVPELDLASIESQESLKMAETVNKIEAKIKENRNLTTKTKDPYVLISIEKQETNQLSQTLQKIAADSVIVTESTFSKISENKIGKEILTEYETTANSNNINEKEIYQQIFKSQSIDTKNSAETSSSAYSEERDLVKDFIAINDMECLNKSLNIEPPQQEDVSKPDPTQESSKDKENSPTLINATDFNLSQKDSVRETDIINEDVQIINNNEENLKKPFNIEQQILDIYSLENNDIENNKTSENVSLIDLTEKEAVEKTSNQLKNSNNSFHIEQKAFEINTVEKESVKDLDITNEDVVTVSNYDENFNKSFNIEQQMFEMYGAEETDVKNTLTIRLTAKELSEVNDEAKSISKNQSTDKMAFENSSEETPAFDLTEVIEKTDIVAVNVSTTSNDFEKSNNSFNIEQQMFEIHAVEEAESRTTTSLHNICEFGSTEEEEEERSDHLKNSKKAASDNSETFDFLSLLTQESSTDIEKEERLIEYHTFDKNASINSITTTKEKSPVKENNLPFTKFAKKSEIIIQDVKIISSINLNNLYNSTYIESKKQEEDSQIFAKSGELNIDVKNKDIVIEIDTVDKTSKKDSTKPKNMLESDLIENESIKETDYEFQNVKLISNDLVSLDRSLYIEYRDSKLIKESTQDNESEEKIIEILSKVNPVPIKSKTTENIDCYDLTDKELTKETDLETETVKTKSGSVRNDESVDELLENSSANKKTTPSTLKQNSNEMKVANLSVETEEAFNDSKETQKTGFDLTFSDSTTSNNHCSKVNTAAKKSISVISIATSKETRKSSRDLTLVLKKELSKYFESLKETADSIRTNKSDEQKCVILPTLTNPSVTETTKNIESESGLDIVSDKSSETSKDYNSKTIDKSVDQSSMITDISITHSSISEVNSSIKPKEHVSSKDYPIAHEAIDNNSITEISTAANDISPSLSNVNSNLQFILSTFPSKEQITEKLSKETSGNRETRKEPSDSERMGDTSLIKVKTQDEANQLTLKEVINPLKTLENVSNVGLLLTPNILNKSQNNFEIESNECSKEKGTYLKEAKNIMNDPDNLKISQNKLKIVAIEFAEQKEGPIKDTEKLMVDTEIDLEKNKQNDNQTELQVNPLKFDKNSPKFCKEALQAAQEHSIEEAEIVEETQNKFKSFTNNTSDRNEGYSSKQTENPIKNAGFDRETTCEDAKQNGNQPELNVSTLKFDRNSSKFLPKTLRDAEEQFLTKCSINISSEVEENLQKLQNAKNILNQNILQEYIDKIQNSKNDSVTKNTDSIKTRGISYEDSKYSENPKEPSLSKDYNNPENCLHTSLDGKEMNKTKSSSLNENKNNSNEKPLDLPKSLNKIVTHTNENVRLAAPQSFNSNVENVRLCLNKFDNQEEKSKEVRKSPKKKSNELSLANNLIENPLNSKDMENKQNVKSRDIQETTKNKYKLQKPNSEEYFHKQNEEKEASKQNPPQKLQKIDPSKVSCVIIPTSETNLNNIEKESISMPKLKETYNKPSQLPSIATNTPTPSNFSGLFSKKSLENDAKDDDFTKSKKKSPHFTSPKLREYILPAASVLCNIDNLENATKANKKLHWELLDNKNEMTEIEDDTDVDNSDEERNMAKKEGYAKDLIPSQEPQPKLTPYKCTESLNSDSDTVSDAETRYGSLSSLNIGSYKNKFLEQRRKTIDTVPITYAVSYYKQLEELELKEKREANKLKKKEARKQLNFVTTKVKKRKKGKRKKVKANLKVSNEMRVRNDECLIDVDFVKETVIKKTKFSIVLTKKQRGRPKKIDNVVKETVGHNITNKRKIEETLQVVKEAKKRGRPKKIKDEDKKYTDLNKSNDSEIGTDQLKVQAEPAKINTEILQQQYEDKQREKGEQQTVNEEYLSENEEFVQQFCKDIPDKSLLSRINKKSDNLDDHKIYQEFLTNCSKREKDSTISKQKQKTNKGKQTDNEMQQLENQVQMAKKKAQQKSEDNVKLFENQKKKQQLNIQEQLRKKEQNQLLEKEDQLRKTKEHKQIEYNVQNFGNQSEKEKPRIENQERLVKKKEQLYREEQEKLQLNSEEQLQKQKEQLQRKEQEKLQLANEKQPTQLLTQQQQREDTAVLNSKINDVSKKNKQSLDDHRIIEEFLLNCSQSDKEKTRNVADVHNESSSSEIECSQENPTRNIKSKFSCENSENLEQNTDLKDTVEQKTTLEHSNDGNNSSVAENSEPECNKYLRDDEHQLTSKDDEHPLTSKDTKISKKSIQQNETNHREEELAVTRQEPKVLETQGSDVAKIKDSFKELIVNKKESYCPKDANPKEYPNVSQTKKCKTLITSSLTIKKPNIKKVEIANNKKKVISLEEIGIKVRPFKGHLSTFRIPKINKDLEVTKEKSWKLETYADVSKENKQQNEGKEKLTENKYDKKLLQREGKCAESTKEKLNCNKKTQQQEEKLNDTRELKKLHHKEKTYHSKKEKCESKTEEAYKNIQYIENAPKTRFDNKISDYPQHSKDHNQLIISQDNQKNEDSKIRRKSLNIPTCSKDSSFDVCTATKELDITTNKHEFDNKPKEGSTTSFSSIKSRRKSLSHKRKLFSPDLCDQDESSDCKFTDIAQSNEQENNDNGKIDENHQVTKKLKEIFLEESHKTTKSNTSIGNNPESFMKDKQQQITQKPISSGKRSLNLQNKMLATSNDDLPAENLLETNENTSHINADNKNPDQIIENIMENTNKYSNSNVSVDNNPKSYTDESNVDVTKKTLLKSRRKFIDLQRISLNTSSEDESMKEALAASHINQVLDHEKVGITSSLRTIRGRKKSINLHRRILDSSCDEGSITDLTPLKRLREKDNSSLLKSIHSKNIKLDVSKIANESDTYANCHAKSIQSSGMLNESEMVNQKTLTSLDKKGQELSQQNNKSSNTLTQAISYKEKCEKNLLSEPITSLRMRRRSLYQERVSLNTLNDGSTDDYKEQAELLNSLGKIQLGVTNPPPVKSLKLRRKSMFQERAPGDVQQEEWENVHSPHLELQRNTAIKQTEAVNNCNEADKTNPPPVKSSKIRRQSMYQERVTLNEQHLGDTQNVTSKNREELIAHNKQKEDTTPIPETSLRTRRKSTYQEGLQQEESNKESQNGTDNTHIKREGTTQTYPIPVKSFQMCRKSVYQEKEQEKQQHIQDENQQSYIRNGNQLLEPQCSTDKMQLEDVDSNNVGEPPNPIPVKSLKMRRKSVHQERHLQEENVKYSQDNSQLEVVNPNIKNPSAVIRRKSMFQEEVTSNDQQDKQILQPQDDIEKNQLEVLNFNKDREHTNPISVKSLRIRRKSIYQKIEEEEIIKPEKSEDKDQREVIASNDEPPLKIRRKSMYQERTTVIDQQEEKEKFSTKVIEPSLTSLGMRRKSETSHKIKEIEKEKLSETDKDKKFLDLHNKRETNRNIEILSSTDLNLNKGSLNNENNSETSIEFTNKKSIKMRRKSINQLRILDSSDEDQEPVINHIKTVTQTEEKTPETAKNPRKRRVVKVLSTSQEEATAIENLQIYNNTTLVSNTSPCLISPTLNHPIFHTEVNEHHINTVPILTPTPNKQYDDKFKEIDSKLNEIFQSPQNNMIDDKTTRPSDISTLSLIAATLNNSQSNITIEETIACNQENDQSYINATQFSDLTTPLNDSSSLEQNLNDVKHLSLGSSDYRFEKVSDNVVNLFISRKRKRKRNN